MWRGWKGVCLILAASSAVGMAADHATAPVPPGFDIGLRFKPTKSNNLLLQLLPALLALTGAGAARSAACWPYTLIPFCGGQSSPSLQTYACWLLSSSDLAWISKGCCAWRIRPICPRWSRVAEGVQGAWNFVTSLVGGFVAWRQTPRVYTRCADRRGAAPSDPSRLCASGSSRETRLRRATMRATSRAPSTGASEVRPSCDAHRRVAGSCSLGRPSQFEFVPDELLPLEASTRSDKDKVDAHLLRGLSCNTSCAVRHVVGRMTRVRSTCTCSMSSAASVNGMS